MILAALQLQAERDQLQAQEELEEMLLDGLNSGLSNVVDDEFWAELRLQCVEELQKQKNAPATC